MTKLKSARWRLSLAITLSICASLIYPTSSEYYTSINDLQDLINAEEHMVKAFEHYLLAVEQQHALMHEYLNETAQKIKTQENYDDFYENPLNAFKLLKRHIINWNRFHTFVFEDTLNEKYVSNLTTWLKKEQYLLPTKEDLDGACSGLARLQNTYAMDTLDVVEGELMGMQFSSAFSAAECFYLGRGLYIGNEPKFAVEWLLQARLRLSKAAKRAYGNYEYPSLTDVQILEYLAPALSVLGYDKWASVLNSELLAQDPTNKFGLDNKDLYANKEFAARHMIFVPVNTTTEKVADTELQYIHAQVCRGELHPTAHEQRNLRCRYFTNNVPFCRIAPFKLEELSHDPPVSFVYEAIYEKEIDQVLDVAHYQLERSTVGEATTTRVSEIRTSKQTWLDYGEHSFLKNLKQRLMDLTGLSLESAEKLQVANYGIGGHYAPHNDFYESVKGSFFEIYGNRILTALFYISDVELGGATAFPFLRLAVPPVKRGMVMWYNMHASGHNDYRTRHGGCPVLVGSKWILNEWFHELGQEFRRPCGLKSEEHKSVAFMYK